MHNDAQSHLPVLYLILTIMITHVLGRPGRMRLRRQRALHLHALDGLSLANEGDEAAPGDPACLSASVAFVDDALALCDQPDKRFSTSRKNAPQVN